MTVKANMPTLYKQLKKLPLARIPSVSRPRPIAGLNKARSAGKLRTIELSPVGGIKRG
jgi:hypothetical protein